MERDLAEKREASAKKLKEEEEQYRIQLQNRKEQGKEERKKKLAAMMNADSELMDIRELLSEEDAKREGHYYLLLFIFSKTKQT